MTHLNIAILVDDVMLEKYKVEILNELQNADFCTIVQFIRRDKEVSLASNDNKYLLYRLFNKMDAKLFGRGTKYLGLESIEDKITASLSNAIKVQELDVILNLSSSEKYYPNNARYGVWQFDYHSIPIGYWEVINNDPFTEIRLVQCSNGLESGAILDTYRTQTDHKSMVKNKEFLLWRSHMMMVRNLKRLAFDPKKFFNNKKSIVSFNLIALANKRRFFDPQFSFSDKSKQAPPTNSQMLSVVYKLLKKYATLSIRKFFVLDRWLILYSETKDGEINPNLSEYQRLYAPSKNYFWADPFVIDEGDKSYLFFEELDYTTQRGYLKVSEYDAAHKSFKKPQMILNLNYHLSYPNVFKHEGKHYMIPESYENKTVDLFEAVEFPTIWIKKKTLLSNISAVDTTLYFRDEKWWMFINIAEKEDFSMNDELHLYFCNNFLSDEWIPHPQNPVICDVTTARPAGNLILKGDKLYRPAQDCSGIYGRKVVINEIEILNETQYKENFAGEINSNFAYDLVAVHTLNSSKKLTVIDAIKSR